MIHKNKNNWVESKRNPFLGEEWVVFENGDGAEGQGGADDPTSEDTQTTEEGQAPAEGEATDQNQQEQTPEEAEPAAPSSVPQEELDRWLAPHNEIARKREDDFVGYMKEWVPGSRPYSPENRVEMETSWGDMMMEYNGVQTYVEHFTNLRNHVLSPDFDPSEERWRAHGIGELYRSFAVLEEIKGLKLGWKTKRKLRQKRAQEVDASKDEIARDLADIIVGLEKARSKMLNMIEEQMRRDFSARIKYLDKQWVENPPPQYSREQVLAHRRDLREAKSAINSNLPNFFEDANDHEARIREYRTVYEDIEKQERMFETDHQDGHEMATIEIGDLPGHYEQLVKLKKEKINPIASAYAAKVDRRVAELRALIAEMEGSNMYDEDHQENKKKDIQGIEKTIANLLGSRDISKILDDTLDNSDPMLDGNDKPIEIEFEDGSKHQAPKGLKQQLKFLDDPRLNPEERRMFAVGLRDAFKKFEKDVHGTVDYFENDLDVIREKIEIQRRGLNAPEPQRKQFELMWFSAYDAVRAFEIIQEWSKRRYQRAATNRVGKFGSKLLAPLSSKHNPISPLRTLPNEFDKETERAEQEEVNQYKEIYANKDMWQVEDVAWNTRNKDEFKACLYLLAENGRLRWDTNEMLKQIMYFQDQVTFSDAQSEIQDISNFYEKLQKALGYMWDFDTFNQMKNQNSSAYDSKQQEYEQNCHEWAESAGTIGKVISGLLSSYKKHGRAAKVDPILYEKIIEYAIKYGKMGPEEKLYYLIQGIALGLLAPDRGSVINSVKINDYPSIDWFGSPTARGPKPTLEDIQEVAQYDYEAFTDWYHREAMTKPRVTQRIDKTLTQGNKLDHDDLTAFLGYMSETTTETMLGKNTDGFRLPQTGVQNGTVSMLFYMDNMAENFNRMSNSGEALVRFIGSFTRYDSILMNRMYREQGANYFRWDTSTYNGVPRAAGNADPGGYTSMYGRSAMSAKGHMEQVREYLQILDPTFFGALYNYDRAEMSDEQAAQIANELVQRYGTEAVFEGDVPKTVDELYQSVGKFASYIVNNQPEKIETMLSKVKKDHAKAFNGYKHHIEAGDKAVKEMRQKRRAMAPIPPAEGSKWNLDPAPPVSASRATF